MKPTWLPDDEAAWNARYGRRLAIVVPYRNRLEHLRTFIPHMALYFAGDKLDRLIEWTIVVVEQDGDGPFNRGLLKNVGFDLVQGDADYVVFHDVDYLPIWADYGFPDRPARLIWHGLSYTEDRDRFFGGVVAFSVEDFRAVNGYPNGYWGWGMEDVELRARCDLAGLAIDRRDGTYRSLPHSSSGWSAQGRTAEAEATRALWRQRAPQLSDLVRSDGIGSLRYTVQSRNTVRVSGLDYPRVELVRVDIGRPDQAV